MADANVHSIPANNWEVYSTDLTVPVACPRCGLPIYMHIIKFSPMAQQYFPDRPYWNFVKNECSRCGEQIIVKYEENPEQQLVEEPKVEEIKDEEKELTKDDKNQSL